MPGMAVEGYVVLSALLFVIGLIGVLVRRSPLVMLMSIEVMWGAASLLFLTFARMWAAMDGHVFTFMIVAVGAAEAAVGLALIVLIFRSRHKADVDDVRALRG
ncbi:MAG: NADH-quinone oxidoreductase subunit NuoK [Limnochordales bacterium]|nr:NADH-quinone oxidoreductase subunit NuoK [Limnochordales bacterium]